MRYLLSCLTLFIFAFSATPYTLAADSTLPRVRIATNLGDMIVELDSNKAPKTVDNFLSYVKDGSYDGTLFHRVIGDFMAQGGAYSAEYKPRPMRASIQNEATNGLKNERGTIAMARGYDPDSATNQFFINVADNPFLDHHAPKPGYWGYTVFGRVTEGMDVLDKIRNTPTGAGGPFAQDVPRIPIIITKISIEPAAPATVVAKADSEKVADAQKPKKKTAKKRNKKSAKKDTKTTAAGETPATPSLAQTGVDKAAIATKDGKTSAK